MQVANTLNNTIRILFNPRVEPFKLFDFLVVKSDDSRYVAQIIEIYDDKFDASQNVAKIKLFYRINENDEVTPYDNFTPNKECEIVKIKHEEIENFVNQDNETFIFGTNIKNSSALNLQYKFFDNNAVVLADKLENAVCMTYNLAKKLSAKKNVVIIDSTGNLELEGAKVIKASKNFKMPFNYATIDHVFNKCLADSTLEFQAIGGEIINEIKRFAKKQEDQFIPFNMLIKVLSEQHNATPYPELRVLLMRIKKFQMDLIFAKNKADKENLTKAIEKNPITIIDLSTISPYWQKVYLDYVISEITQDIYLITRINDEHFDTTLINKIYNNKENIKFVPTVSYNYKKLPTVMQNCKNYILMPSLYQRNDFLDANFALSNLIPEGCIIFGKDTDNFLYLARDYELEIQESKKNYKKIELSVLHAQNSLQHDLEAKTDYYEQKEQQEKIREQEAKVSSEIASFKASKEEGFEQTKTFTKTIIQEVPSQSSEESFEEIENPASQQVMVEEDYFSAIDSNDASAKNDDGDEFQELELEEITPEEMVIEEELEELEEEVVKQEVNEPAEIEEEVEETEEASEEIIEEEIEEELPQEETEEIVEEVVVEEEIEEEVEESSEDNQELVEEVVEEEIIVEDDGEEIIEEEIIEEEVIVEEEVEEEVIEEETEEEVLVDETNNDSEEVVEEEIVEEEVEEEKDIFEELGLKDSNVDDFEDVEDSEEFEELQEGEVLFETDEDFMIETAEEEPEDEGGLTYDDLLNSAQKKNTNEPIEQAETAEKATEITEEKVEEKAEEQPQESAKEAIVEVAKETVEKTEEIPAEEIVETVEEAAKEEVKETVEEAAKEEVKETVEEAAKEEVIVEATNEEPVIEAIKEEVVEETSEEIISEEPEENLSQEPAKEVVEEAIEEVAPQEIKEEIKEVLVEETVADVVEIEPKQEAKEAPQEVQIETEEIALEENLLIDDTELNIVDEELDIVVEQEAPNEVKKEEIKKEEADIVAIDEVAVVEEPSSAEVQKEEPKKEELDIIVEEEKQEDNVLVEEIKEEVVVEQEKIEPQEIIQEEEKAQEATQETVQEEDDYDLSDDELDFFQMADDEGGFEESEEETEKESEEQQQEESSSISFEDDDVDLSAIAESSLNDSFEEIINTKAPQKAQGVVIDDKTSIDIDIVNTQTKDSNLPIFKEKREIPKDAIKFKVGDIVRHPKFGKGVVTKTAGKSGMNLVGIEFEEVGFKTIEPISGKLELEQ